MSRTLSPAWNTSLPTPIDLLQINILVKMLSLLRSTLLFPTNCGLRAFLLWKFPSQLALSCLLELSCAHLLTCLTLQQIVSTPPRGGADSCQCTWQALNGHLLKSEHILHPMALSGPLLLLPQWVPSLDSLRPVCRTSLDCVFKKIFYFSLLLNISLSDKMSNVRSIHIPTTQL